MSKVIAKLKKYRTENEGNTTHTLTETGIVVEFPKFRKHGDWQRALRIAKNKIGAAQVLYICKIATFDGEKLTPADFDTYIPNNDANELLMEIFGDDDDDDWGDEEEVGNDQPTKA